MLVPAKANSDALRLVCARALRGFADGAVSVVLPAYLMATGLSPFEVGAVATATLLGSAALTLAVGLVAHRLSARATLLATTLLMLGTGLGFAHVTAFWPLLAIAFVGTLNPSVGDVSIFLPIEQSLLASSAPAASRTALYARYNVAGALAAALGSLAAASPELLAKWTNLSQTAALRSVFFVYAAVAVAIGAFYLGLGKTADAAADREPRRPLARSRPVVLRLAALFTLDSFGGGFVVQSLLALWLFQRFDLSLTAVAQVFFVTSLLGALSQLVSPRLAARIGLIRTMVYTHVPANAFLVIAAFMPTAPLALAFLFLRMALSSMDVPARQAYVMSVVPPEERAAAASVTNVPRSLGAGLAPLVSGWMLAHSTFGWPLIVGGLLKIVYDLLLLARFRHHEPPQEATEAR